LEGTKWAEKKQSKPNKKAEQWAKKAEQK